ncbi:hypothetical protein I552_3602 [Mycobacterium xenopi 3993]|nr:hypothetical protein I552_3602 [Mycobacterium xenopi 3993]
MVIGTSPGLVNPGWSATGRGGPGVSPAVPGVSPLGRCQPRWAQPAGLVSPVPGVSPGVAGVAPPGWSDRVSSRRVW